jgi:hypothetical protein
MAAPRAGRFAPMTLANMRANGVRSLLLSCPACGHEAVMNVDHLPERVSVPEFGPRLVCTRCGLVGGQARPDWNEVAQPRPAGPR